MYWYANTHTNWIFNCPVLPSECGIHTYTSSLDRTRTSVHVFALDICQSKNKSCKCDLNKDLQLDFQVCSYSVIHVHHTHTLWYRSCHFFCLGAGLFPSPAGQAPVLANFLRRDIQSESDMPLCDFEDFAFGDINVFQSRPSCFDLTIFWLPDKEFGFRSRGSTQELAGWAVARTTTFTAPGTGLSDGC